MFMSTPIRRIGSGCCPRAINGHAATEVPINDKKSRRLIAPPTFKTGHGINLE